LVEFGYFFYCSDKTQQPLESALSEPTSFSARVAYSSQPPESDTGAEVDINRDGTIDDADYSFVEWAFGSSPWDANWSIDADVNNDGLITKRALL